MAEPAIAVLSLLAAACLATWPACAAAGSGPAGEGWYFEAASAHHADALPLADLGHDDAAARLQPRAGRNLACVEDEVRAGRRQGAWTVSLLARSSATLVASADTLNLAATLAQSASAAPQRHWSVDARFAAFSGSGLELRRAFVPASGWQAEAWVQALSLARWRERRLQGSVDNSAAAGGFGFNLVSGRLDDHLQFAFQQPVAGSGQGLLLGGRLAWQLEGLTLEASVSDLGWLRWTRLPREDATLSTQTQALDPDGFLIYKPLVQGQYSQAGATRGLGGRREVALHWQAGPADRLSARVASRPGFSALPQLAWQHQLGPALALGALWRVHERQFGLDLQWQGWHAQLATDRPDGQARSRALLLGWQQGF
jgi:hypothetical protein